MKVSTPKRATAPMKAGKTPSFGSKKKASSMKKNESARNKMC